MFARVCANAQRWLSASEGIEEVVISKEVVEGTTPPLYVYAARANHVSAL